MAWLSLQIIDQKPRPLPQTYSELLAAVGYIRRPVLILNARLTIFSGTDS